MVGFRRPDEAFKLHRQQVAFSHDARYAFAVDGHSSAPQLCGYHEGRTRLGLGKDTPGGRAAASQPSSHKIVSFRRLAACITDIASRPNKLCWKLWSFSEAGNSMSGIFGDRVRRPGFWQGIAVEGRHAEPPRGEGSDICSATRRRLVLTKHGNRPGSGFRVPIATSNASVASRLARVRPSFRPNDPAGNASGRPRYF